MYKNHPAKNLPREKLKGVHLVKWCYRLAPCGMVPPCKACPGPLTAPWEGGPAEVLTPNILQGWPRAFFNGTGIVRTEAKHPPSHPVPSPFHEKKARDQASHVVSGRIRFLLCPQRRGFFLSGDISWHRHFTWCLAVPLTPGCGGGPGTSVNTSTLPARPPPPAARLLSLPKKRE